MALPWPSPWDVLAAAVMWLAILVKTFWPILLMLVAFVILRIVVERRVARRRYRGQRYLVVELDEE